MLVVNVEVLKIRDSDTGSATIHVEKRRGEAWLREKVYDFTPSTPDARRRLVLEDDQRVVVMGVAGTEVVFDKEQSAAVPVATSSEPVKPVVPEQKPVSTPASTVGVNKK